jgi:hypothetical protein
MAEIGQVPGGGLPWGDIVKIQTPFTDQVTASLLAQQADRKKFEQETALHTDELMNKELANVRSVDMGPVMESFGKWKNIATQMLNPKVQADPKAYNALQIQKNAALGQTMGLINRSAQYNALGKQIGTNIQSKADYYGDDAGKMLSTFYNTPMEQLTAASYNGKPTDLTDLEQYRYKGGTDLSKLHAAALGKPTTHYDNGTTDASGIQTTQHGYQYGNTPQEYRNAYLPGLAGNQANRTARYNWNQHSTNQQDLDALDAAYQNSPNWKKMGISPQPLPAYNPNDPVGNEATYQAKQYLVGMNPAEVKASVVTNEAAKLAKQFDQRIVMEALREGNREKLAGMRHDWKKLDAAAKDNVMNGVVQGMLEKAKAHPKQYKLAEGKVIQQYEIPASTILKKEFAVPDDKGHPILVDAFRLSEDGQTVTPIFFTPGQTGGTKAVDADISKPMTIGEFKARAAKAMFGVKESARETSDNTQQDKDNSNPAPAKKAPKLAPGAFNDIH